MNEREAAFINAVENLVARLLNASWEYPFGPGTEVAMVGGKMFALLSDGGGGLGVNVKARPEDVVRLRASNEHVLPGYHMNKKHWVTVVPGIDMVLLEELLIESYFLAAAGIAQKHRPALGIAEGSDFDA